MTRTNRTRWLLLSLFLAAAPLTLAHADPWDDAMAAHARGDSSALIQYLRPLAEQGDVLCQTTLGAVHYYRKGVSQDYAEAVKWYRLAAEQGDAGAQYMLGVMYANGQGVRQDDIEGVKWYRRAAEQGDPNAQFNLGMSYAEGQGVPQDFVQAHIWFNLAASQIPASERDEAFEGRDRVAARMTPAQIAEAQKLAREWKPTK